MHEKSKIRRIHDFIYSPRLRTDYPEIVPERRLGPYFFIRDHTFVGLDFGEDYSEESNSKRVSLDELNLTDEERAIRLMKVDPWIKMSVKRGSKLMPEKGPVPIARIEHYRKHRENIEVTLFAKKSDSHDLTSYFDKKFRERVLSAWDFLHSGLEGIGIPVKVAENYFDIIIVGGMPKITT